MTGLSTFSTFKHMMAQCPGLHTLSQEETEAVQEVLLQIMDDIHNTCKDNGLHYVLTGGSALGAVRHKGFIPWDDDIDLCMPRKDYDQFRAVMAQAFPDKYYVQEVRACEEYDLNFMKVRLNGTKFCEALDPEPGRSGIFIDIYPVENAADNKFLRSMQRILSDGMQFICSCIRIRKKRKCLLDMAGDSQKAARAIRVKSAIAVLFSLVPFRRWLIWTERILSMNKNENSSYIVIPAGRKHFKGELYPRGWFFPEKEVDFQGRAYFSVAEAGQYLKRMYGDYQEIPPEEEREKHVLLDFSLPHD